MVELVVIEHPQNVPGSNLNVKSNRYKNWMVVRRSDGHCVDPILLMYNTTDVLSD